MKLVTWAVVFCLLCCTVARAQPSRSMPIPIFVDGYKSNDPVGRRVIFALEQNIERSAQYRLTYDIKQSMYDVHLITMNVFDSGRYQNKITAVSIVVSGYSPYGQMLVAQNLDICGDEAVQSCAANIMSSIAHDIDYDRSSSR